MATCKIGTFLYCLDSQERSALTAALADRDEWSAKRIARAITSTDEGGAKDFTVGATTVKEHRNKVCACYG